MGKRKSIAKAQRPKKRQEKLAEVFKCPFCNHAESVECTIFKKEQLGVLFCRICREVFKAITHALSEPIDVYSDWLDECERVNVRNH
ncbi:hypothetical protein R1flu_016733 [Riccia fluitans]|uniref:Transcription elongation factor 1 homolog n=1 Tax=Riccia fluitans TaxID=41844 RepID=A0ABD1YRK3_9MARC